MTASRRRFALLAGVVVLAAVLAHARGLGHGFVYDDHRFIERNRAITSIGNVGSFFSDPATASAAAGVEPDIYRPVRTLSFALDHALFGLSPTGWHAGSIALHAANAALVWLFLLRRLRRHPGARLVGHGRPALDDREASLGATFGALLFAVHPVTTESVVWVSSRGDLIAWTFALLAFEAFTRVGARATAAGVALGALACLAKESALVLFALVPIAHLALPREARPTWNTTWMRAGALVGVTVGYLLLRQAVLPGAPDLPYLAQTDFPDGGRVGALRGFLSSVAWYARTLLWPFGFPFDRNVHTDPIPSSFLDPGVVVGAGIVLTLLLVGVRALVRRRGVTAAACLGTLAALGPVSNVVVPLKAFAAERFLYPALPFLALGFGAVLFAAREAFPRRRRATAGLAVTLLAGLGMLAFARAGPWHDETSLWRAVMVENPMNPRAHEGIGFGQLLEGRVDLAERSFRTYREFQPRDGKVRAELAATFLRLSADLVPKDVSQFENTNLGERRRLALGEAIAESRAAWQAWSREGITRARGDIALVRRMLEGWRAAALDYGDLRETAFVNAILAEDDRRRTGAVAYDEKRFVPMLAGLAIVTAPPADRPDRDPARARARAEVRAELLSAAGIDPARSDQDGIVALLPILSTLLLEQPGDLATRRVRKQLLATRLDELAERMPHGELEMFRTDLELLLRADPRDKALADMIDELRRGRGPR